MDISFKGAYFIASPPDYKVKLALAQKDTRWYCQENPVRRHVPLEPQDGFHLDFEVTGREKNALHSLKQLMKRLESRDGFHLDLVVTGPEKNALHSLDQLMKRYFSRRNKDFYALMELDKARKLLIANIVENAKKIFLVDRPSDLTKVPVLRRLKF